MTKSYDLHDLPFGLRRKTGSQLVHCSQTHPEMVPPTYHERLSGNPRILMLASIRKYRHRVIHADLWG